MAYYPDWAAPAFPPEKIDFGRFDWIDFAFAVPDQKYNLTWDGSDDDPSLLTRLVSAAHNSGKKVKLSVGGWSGSKYFSTAVSNQNNRQTLVNNLLAAYQQFNLDGIDIDWEYPGQDGADGNIVNPNDTANFLLFLQLLRTTLPPTSKISAAVQTVPFADTQGNPMTDVSDFAKVLDWVLLMNYDSWGSSATPGPNAPLSDGCHNSTQGSANAAAALNAWTSAGFPASQLVLGVPSYGYISRSNATVLRTRSQSWHSLHRNRLRRSLLGLTEAVVSGLETAASPAIQATNEDGGTNNGQIQFRDLVSQGVLQYAPEDANNTATGAPTSMLVNGREIDSLYDGWSGFSRYWDNCSSTPFLRSPHADQVVTYDDPLSLGLKAAFAAQSGMLGVNMFDVHGDTDQWDLTDALRKGLGLG
ncbi:glycoside hydrolase [Sparassis latifolia]